MKKHMSRSLCSLVLMLCLLITTASAAQPPTQTVQPMYTSITSFSTTLSITSGGKANCYARATGSDSSYSVTLTVRLQQSSDQNSWTTLSSWTTTGVSPVVNKNRYVESGYYYRLYCTANVSNASGNRIGSNTKTSSVSYY